MWQRSPEYGRRVDSRGRGSKGEDYVAPGSVFGPEWWREEAGI